MKRNKIYLAGIVLCAIGLLSGCDEDLPSYANLTVDAKTLTIDLDKTTEGSFNIIEGNGGYKVSSSDATVATAIISGNEVIVTGLEYGTATLTVSDWTKNFANVKVVVAQEQELAVNTKSTTMFFEEYKTFEIYTGNGGYSITSSDETIATAKISEDGKIEITSSSVPGTATLTVKDSHNKTAEIAVKVIKRLVVDNNEDITYLITGEPVTIKILDGNGEYTCSLPSTSAANYIKCTVAENGTEVIIEGLKRNYFNKAITIKDKEGQSVDIHIKTIDEPYSENPSYRYLIAGSYSYQSPGTSKVGEVIYSEELNLSLLTIKSTGSYASGFAVQFTGNLEKGTKTNAVLYKVTKNAVDRKVAYPVEDCKIDKIENGWYWVSFLEPGYTVRSYFITKQ
jgi:hypothetical protein